MALVLVGCSGSGSDQSGEHGSGEESRERSKASESGEHSGGSDSSERGAESESGEHGGGSESGDGAEESGTQYTLSETFDHVRAGARLVLSYDSAGNAFTGKVENTTSDKLDRVRVEVHLSNGIELGPTTPVDSWPPVRQLRSRCKPPANPSYRGAPTPRWEAVVAATPNRLSM